MSPTAIIRKALLRSAEYGTSCPTNIDLGRLIDQHSDSAGRHLREMLRSGAIQIEKQGHTKRRILINGKWTGWTQCGPKRIERTETGNRLCLSCRKQFESAWAGERVCKRCKGTADWRAGA